MDLLDSWTRSLRAAGRSPATISAYLTDARGYLEYLDADLVEATRRDVESYLVACRDRGLSDATVARRYRSLRQLYRWLEDEEELAGPNPMGKMTPPKVVDQPPPMPSDEDVRALVKACRSDAKASNGRHGKFEQARDTAIVLVLATTGIRASELIGMRVADAHLGAETITVTGKGGRTRVVPLMFQPLEQLDRYVRARRRHPSAKYPELWLGERGPLTDSGLRQMLERRCVDAGIDRINPHALRHRFAHVAKTRGLSDENLMVLAGWSTPQMLARYGRSAQSERAQQAARDLFRDERL
ncbi:integrase/recombinase XerD [Ilumatobacter fluminis]|uniref:Integrase/recombinase XerD n=1 Tax=Ilumatobacter fluminis TaxID=467091 RepID=A0A4R7I023_9ACTN|nr:tyrosine-type recombinase/integrase [Ilumatobacter fluminis]TDT16735.1 integrase/recombinase XerD [Ilumatobacter fluminis]